MAAKAYQDISVSCEDQVVSIEINRVDKLNAIRIQTYRELISAFRQADESEDCRLIVLSGKGDQFTAGNDLADLVTDDHAELMECVQQIFDTVAGLKKVVLAVVDGVAVGIGTTILLHCDIVIATDRAKFRLPFVNLGVAPEGAASVLLPGTIGQKNARDVLLTGRFFSSQEALDWGLITTKIAPGDIEKVTEKYISILTKQPKASLIATKALMGASYPDVRSTVQHELESFAALLQTDETRMRIRSFIKS